MGAVTRRGRRRRPTTGPVHATVTVPGSKSQTNRALVLAALATAAGHLDDQRRAAQPRHRPDDRRAAHARRHRRRRRHRVDGQRPHRPGRRTPASTAAWRARCCGSSRRSRRCRTETVVFDGDEQARARPIAPLLDALRGLGVDIDGDGLPFSVRGSGAVRRRHRRDRRVGVVAVRLRACCCPARRFTDGLTIVHTGESVPSAPHVAMTVAMLREAGVDVDDTQANRWRVSPGPIAARHWVIEPDLSNAVPFLAAAVVSGGIVRIAGWPSASMQPADTILDILRSWDAIVRHSRFVSGSAGRRSLRRLRRRPARCRRAGPGGGGAGRARRRRARCRSCTASPICAATRPTGWPR